MSEPTARNRLDEEASPYLRQHADNPVNWQPWDDTALEAAREQEKPIFLSIGYAACHWCHVMEEESFEDDDVAELLNENFVPIKVDREERPDLDRIYQTVCRRVSGGGGWPLSVWLTPDGDPFYVGTYFPPEPKQNMPGFTDICENVAESWSNPDERADMRDRGEQWAGTARDELETTSNGADSEAVADDDLDSILDDAVSTAIRSADREYGGFGRGGPKFPQPGRIDLLLRAASHGESREPLAVARETLDAMANGGLYDHVGGGFHRYCTDREWVVPHFEKMLYDNAELSRVFLDAHRVTGDSRYAVVARETFAFLDRELSHPDGGFYATLDADSGDGEGAFYVWNEDTLADALDAELSAEDLSELGVDRATVEGIVRDRYGIGTPNFEGGETVLTVSASVEDLAESFDTDEATVQQTLQYGRVALQQARENRERPPRDEKVIAAWNGLAISAYATGARTLDSVLAERAADAVEFARERLWDGDRLARRYVDPADLDDDAPESAGGTKGTGYLDDYAFLARGAFDLYQTTGEVAHLDFAVELAEVILAAFYDEDAGTIFATPSDGEELIARPQEPTDQSTPSSLGVAVSLLLDLDHFAPEAGFADAATDALATQHDRIGGRPLEHVSLALAAAKHARGPLEITLAADEWPDEWRATLAEQPLADAVIAPRPATESGMDEWLDELGLSEAPPIWANRAVRDGEATAYVCRSRTCSPPKAELLEALRWTPGE